MPKARKLQIALEGYWGDTQSKKQKPRSMYPVSYTHLTLPTKA